MGCDEITNGNRACGFVISSGRNKLWLEVAPAGSVGGSVKTSRTPRRGNEVSVMGTSWGKRYALANLRLYRIFCSTVRRFDTVPLYGDPGVDSSMYRPYSGWNVGTEPLQI